MDLVAYDYSNYHKKNHREPIPKFGSWDFNTEFALSQCFESARARETEFRHSYSRDGDLYQPTTNAVINRRRGKIRNGYEKEGIKEQNWEVKKIKPKSSTNKNIKPVDADLYRISPHLLYSKSHKRRGMGLFSSCLFPDCVL